MKLIAVDIGSTYAKCAVLQSHNGVMLEKQVRPMPEKLPLTEKERFELSPEEIFLLVKAMIDDCLERHRDIQAIYLDTQMHGYILSEMDGTGAESYISWQDTLAEPLLPELAERLGQTALRHMGTRFKAGLAVCSFYARHKKKPLLRNQLLHTLGGYIYYRLSDGRAHICHESMAASLGLYDCAEHTWNKQTLQVIGGQKLILPTVISHTQAAGMYKGIPLYGDIGDHQASVYGLEAEEANSIVLTLGTAGILCMPSTKSFYEGMEGRPFFHEKWLLTKTRQPGGRTLDLLIDFIRNCGEMSTGQTLSTQQIWQTLLEDLPEQTQGLQVKPDYFIGAGQGEIQGIGVNNFKPRLLFAAAIDGLAQAYAKTIEAFRKIEPGLQRILLCGGRLAKLERLQKALECCTGLQVVCSTKQDEALYGLAKLAAEQEEKIFDYKEISR